MVIERTHEGRTATFEWQWEREVCATHERLLDAGFGVVESARMAFARHGIDPNKHGGDVWDWLIG